MDTKKPPEGLGSVVGLVLGLGQLDFCLVEGSEVPQGLRFEPIGDGPRLFPGIGAVMGGECLNPGHHVPGLAPPAVIFTRILCLPMVSTNKKGQKRGS